MQQFNPENRINNEMRKMKECNNQPIYLQIAVLMGCINGRENAVVLGGRGGIIDPSAAMAGMGR
jgi:hypothetical protein